MIIDINKVKVIPKIIDNNFGVCVYGKPNVDNLKQEIFKQINSISIIEINEFFNILNYE